MRKKIENKILDAFEAELNKCETEAFATASPVEVTSEKV
jgi:hypothetical protein